MADVAGFAKGDGKKNPFKNNDLPQMAQMAGWKWHGVDSDDGGKIKRAKKKCKWNVNKPCRNVNQKVAKMANRHDKWQFTHGSTAEHYYYIFYLYFYIN